MPKPASRSARRRPDESGSRPASVKVSANSDSGPGGAPGNAATGASLGPGGTIEIRADHQLGSLLGTASVTPTGDWQVYKNVTAALETVSGLQSLALVFRGAPGGLFNINWIDFLRSSDERPTAVDDAYIAPHHLPFTIGGLGVLANDFDSQLDPLRARLVAQPNHGAVEFNADGSFTYLPEADYIGPANFSYVAEQGVPTTIVPLGSTWRFLDNGSNQGAAWRTRDFDDSGWAVGAAQLGYGDGDETSLVAFGPTSSQKYITTYFRHEFQVDDLDKYASLKLRLLRDDGAGIFLNGELVGYSNLAAGASSTTPAGPAVGDAQEEAFVEFVVDPADLQLGKNVLAVEIHQSSGNSSDLSFDLELIGGLQSEVATVRLDLRGPRRRTVAYLGLMDKAGRLGVEQAADPPHSAAAHLGARSRHGKRREHRVSQDGRARVRSNAASAACSGRTRARPGCSTSACAAMNQARHRSNGRRSNAGARGRN